MRLRIAALLFLLLVGTDSFAQQVLSTSATGVVQASIDANGWRNFKVTLTRNATFQFVGIPTPAQATVTVMFVQNNVGGFTVTFASFTDPATTLVISISNPCTVASAANAVTFCQFQFDGTTNTWSGLAGSGGAGTFTTITAASINNIIFADQQAGATMGVKVNNCLLAVQANGTSGICDARGINGAQTISSDMFAGLNGANSIVLLLGRINGSISATQNPPNAMAIFGSGVDATNLSINMATGNVFVPQGNNFEMAEMQVSLAAAVTRTAGYFMAPNTNLLNCSVHDMKFTDIYGGFLFQGASGTAPKECRFQDLQIQTTLGKHAAAFFKFGTGGDGSGISDIYIRNITSLGNSATYDEAEFIIDGGIDTLRVDTFDASYSTNNPSTQPVILVQNTTAGWNPRWIRMQRLALEGGSTANCMNISAATDLMIVDSYFENCLVGVSMTGGFGIRLQGGIIANNMNGGLSVTSAASQLSVDNILFGNNSRTTTNTTDDILIGASTTLFSITNNKFDQITGLVAVKSRYGINIGAAAANFTVTGNTWNVGAIGTLAINDASGQVTKVVQNGFDAVPLISFRGNSTSNNQHVEICNSAASGRCFRFGEIFNVGIIDIRDTSTNGAFAFQMNTANEVVFAHSASARRVVTFPDAAIAKVADTGTLTLKKGSGAGNYTSASTTYVVVDSTNLCLTVTIPTGWKLGVVVNGALGTATGAVVANLALTDNAACSTANAGILVETTETTTAAAVLQPVGLSYVITGDGASHNVALQFKTSNAADSATLANSTATLTPQMVFTLMPSN